MQFPRRFLATAAVAVASATIAAAPAAAKPPKGEFSYHAVIDCGSGPVEVGSGDDLWAPLVDLASGKKYKPVAWDVSGPGFAVVVFKKGEPKKKAVDCSYSDGVATGTVTVKKA